MPLRIAISESPPYIVKEPGGKLNGPVGNLLQNYYQKLFNNSTFVIADLKGDSGLTENIGTGNGSSFEEVFLRKEADILSAAAEYGMLPSFLSPASQIAALPGAAIHEPLLSIANQEVLNTFNIFPFKTMGIILISIMAFGVCFAIKARHGLLDTYSSLARSLINQTNFNTQILISKAMIFIWLIASFALMEIYEQAMNADMVSLDYSSIVDSVLDLDRHKSYKPIFLQGEFIREQFKRSKDSVKMRIWNRRNKEVLNMDFTGMMKVGQTVGQKDDVVIGISDIVESGGNFFCGLKKRNLDQSHPKYLIGRRGFGLVNLAMYYRVNLEANVKSLIWHKSLTTAAGGHVYNLFHRFSEMVALNSPESTPSCLCYTKEELYDNVDTLGPIRTNNMVSLYRAFFILLAVSIVSNLVEVGVYYLRVMNVINIYRRSISILKFTTILILHNIVGLLRYLINKFRRTQA